MLRLPLAIVAILLAVAAAPSLSAEVVTEYNDFVVLDDHETIRYRVQLDYGAGTDADVDIWVRGYDAPPRVRVLDSDRDEKKDVRDTDGDWTLDFDFRAAEPHTVYYIELDSAEPWQEGGFDVRITVNAPAGNGAEATISFSSDFYDHESGDDSDHYDCAAGPGRRGLPLLLPALLGLGAYWFRRRRQ